MSDTKKSNGLSLVAMVLSLITVILATWALFAAHGKRPPPPRTGGWTTLTRPMAFDAEAREEARDFIATQVEHQTSAAQSNMGTFTSAVMTSVAILITVSLFVMGFTWWRQKRDYDAIVKEAENAAEQALAHAKQAEKSFKDKLAEIDDRAKQVFENIAKKIDSRKKLLFKDIAKKKDASLEEIDTTGEAFGYFLQAAVSLKKNDFDEAIKLYTKAIELKPDFADAYVNRGVAWLNSDETGKAIANFTEAIKLKPGYAIAYYGRGMARGKTGETEKAIADYTKAIELKPDFAIAYLDLAEALITVQRFGDAATCLEDGLRNVPEMTDYSRLGVAYLKAMATILGGKGTAKAEAEVSRMLTAGVKLTDWDFGHIDRFLKNRRGKTFTKARALHKKVKLASQKK